MATLLTLRSPIKYFKFSANLIVYIFLFYTDWCKIIDITPIGVIKYEKIKEYLLENIQNGTYIPDRPIPPERELAAMLCAFLPAV